MDIIHIIHIWPLLAVVPRTPKRSQLLDSQTKHDLQVLQRLTVQQTRGPISRSLGCAKRQKRRAWTSPSPSVALCCIGRTSTGTGTGTGTDTSTGTGTPHTTPRYRRLYIRCCRDRDVAWRGRHLVINSPTSFRHCRFRTKRHMRP